MTTTKMKCAINRSIITRIVCIYTFNITNFPVIVRKCNNVFSLFSVSGKCIQLSQRELELDEVRFVLHIGKFKSSKRVWNICCRFAMTL
jgi:hypothetical protein